MRSAADWARTLLPYIGSTAEVIAAPAGQGVWADRADASDLRYPLTLDTTRIRNELGFSEVQPESAAIKKTIASYSLPAH